MVSRRWLALGRPLAAFAATPLLLLLSTFARNANAVLNVPDLIKLAELRSFIQMPRFHGVDDPADLLPDWYIAWRILLQNQTDRLFLALEKRTRAHKSEKLGGGVTLEIDSDDRRGFKIHVVGDSTMRMQANVLSWILSQRTTADGRKQCITYGDGGDPNMVDMRCTGPDRGVNKFGNPPKGEGFVLSLEYTKEFDSCVAPSVDADFVYFGCGMHFLQIDPDRRVSSGHLDIWVHYERLLEEAVTFYRSGGGSTANRIPMGEAFMTTHSFALDRLDGEYAIRVQEYEDGYEPTLASCRETANNQTLRHEDWPNEFEPEEICTLGIFSQSGVFNLNQRAEDVMDRLGVPVVQGYDITGGQSWATPPRDGRHYPALIPMEVSALLSEITTALRRERREAAA